MWNMVIHERLIPLELVIYKRLRPRMVIAENEVKKFLAIEKGYEGEVRSDEWLTGLNQHWLVLHGLLLEYNGSRFQIDTLIIAYEKIYLLDVKHFEGDYYLEEEHWSTKSNSNILNPLDQLRRCTTLLRKLLFELGFKDPIDPYLTFNNPEFHLYITTINPTLIFPTQLNRFLKKLNTNPVKLNQRYYELAEKLASLHIIESPYSRVPAYSFEECKKGGVCIDCGAMYTSVNKDKLECGACGCQEKVDEAVIRNVKDYILLFPDRKITVRDIYEWCGFIVSKKTIRRILSRNFKLEGFGPSAHYVKKE